MSEDTMPSSDITRVEIPSSFTFTFTSFYPRLHPFYLLHSTLAFIPSTFYLLPSASSPSTSTYRYNKNINKDEQVPLPPGQLHDHPRLPLHQTHSTQTHRNQPAPPRSLPPLPQQYRTPSLIGLPPPGPGRPGLPWTHPPGLGRGG